ncbi:prolipoprotein diacylglyceryl transferase [Amnibacterium kyonggiense]|uniref:Phosphatidylglycerol--prolipoprotein diacylglyceryl transferase n=1 Tax=Amnibacterium kyonggiense TaxID=595671 RepID=A0A4R7FSN5_9MICO|nr:prolipoprotein diacylglyceryl transferase [Amnibacterium kyonggiense]TDS80816.1 prolipoprotein diacylglyceryl transferase [Amnibacterium kyonggiense]
MLRSIPSPPASWASFHIGPLDVHVYALCIMAGIVAAVAITARRLSRRGVPGGFVVDAALWIVPIGIVVARLYHVFTHTGDYFFPGANLWNVFAIWDGGDAIFGSMIGGFIGIVIACRRAGVRITAFVDALAPALLVAQAIGRIGNWFNHELFGLPTTLPWGLVIPRPNVAIPPGTPADTLFHPLFLYELLFDLLGAALIAYLGRRFTLQWGKQIGLYFVWYGAVRAWLEAIRIDPTSNRFLGLGVNDWTAMGAVVLGIVILVVQTRRHPGPEPSPWTREPAPALVETSEQEPAQRR